MINFASKSCWVACDAIFFGFFVNLWSSNDFVKASNICESHGRYLKLYRICDTVSLFRLWCIHASSHKATHNRALRNAQNIFLCVPPFFLSNRWLDPYLPFFPSRMGLIPGRVILNRYALNLTSLPTSSCYLQYLLLGCVLFSHFLKM